MAKNIRPLTEMPEGLRLKIIEKYGLDRVNKSPTMLEQITNLELALVEIYEVMLNG